MLNETMRREYETLFETCIVREERKIEVEKVITRIMKARDRYEKVSARNNVPWFIIAVIHNMECGGRFDCHLHNGDPLTARTRQVPAGRPASGEPPFTWEDSAIDALAYDGFDVWEDWSIGGVLFKLERFNGTGYRSRGFASPYLWAASPHYVRGKFVRDGVFDAKAVSQQIGAAVILRRMLDQALICEFEGSQPRTESAVRVIAKPSLNVRNEPGSTGRVIGQALHGSTALVIDKSADGVWTKVRVNFKLTGWVSSAYVVAAGDGATS